MNTISAKLPLSQERYAYRRAVKLTLVAFFEKSPVEATRLVASWWQRLGKSDAFTTGLFMHDEPLNTAAALANASRTPSIREVGDAYSKIIEASMPKPRAHNKKQLGHDSRSAHAA